MEARSRISISMLPRGQLAEVLRGLGDDIVVQLEHDATSILAVNGDIELRHKLARSMSAAGTGTYENVGHDEKLVVVIDDR